MKVGDLVKVSKDHHADRGLVGIIIEDIFNKGKAFKVLFAHGRVRPKFSRHIEVISESR